MKYLHTSLDNLCPVCGFDLKVPSWVIGVPTWGLICPSCGIEFGLDDTLGTDEEKKHIYINWRKQWIQNGMKWWSTRSQPSNWNPKKQLKNIPKEFLGPDERY